MAMHNEDLVTALRSLLFGSVQGLYVRVEMKEFELLMERFEPSYHRTDSVVIYPDLRRSVVGAATTARRHRSSTRIYGGGVFPPPRGIVEDSFEQTLAVLVP